MNPVMRGQSFEEISSAIATVEDRRTHDRLKLMKTMHISYFDSELTQEIATVVDISRQGLYFTVRSGPYCIGMEMKVTIPSLGFEGVCKVVRIEELPSGDVGIGGLVLGW